MIASTLLTSLLALGVLGGPILVTDTELVVKTVFKTKDVWVAPSTSVEVDPVATHAHHHKHKPKPIKPHHFVKPHKQQAPAPAPVPAPSSAPAPAPAPTKQHHPAPVPTVPAGTGLLQQAVLISHNVHRANHSAPALTWSDNLAQIAQDEANVCIYAHNVTGGGGGYGQNIAAGVAEDQISTVITNMFYNGEVNNYAGFYGMANPPMEGFEEFGHFTQVVWKGTTSVGCAVADCSSTGLGNAPGISPYFTVCNYGPPGNYGGEYGTNVGSSLGHPSVDPSYGGVQW